MTPTVSAASSPPRPLRSRLLRYAPLVGWMALIFFASSGEFSANNTSRIVGPLLRWLFPHITEHAINCVHFLIRKCGHFSEYAVFALLAARAFLDSAHTALRRHWFAAALLLNFLYALADEYHQSFVPSRTASIYDSFIDTTGGIVALCIVALWRLLHKKSNAALS